MTLTDALDIIAAWQAKSAQRVHMFHEHRGGIVSQLLVAGEVVAEYWPTEFYPDGRVRSAQRIKREGEPGGMWSDLNYSVEDKADDPDGK
jgi:hypothetical protein